MLETTKEVVRCLITYADWWQPSTGSVLAVGRARPDRNLSDGLNPGIIETIEERNELCRRVARLSERERLSLFLFFVRQLHVDDIATSMQLSRRQCYRLRSRALQKLVDIGRDEAA